MSPLPPLFPVYPTIRSLPLTVETPRPEPSRFTSFISFSLALPATDPACLSVSHALYPSLLFASTPANIVSFITVSRILSSRLLMIDFARPRYPPVSHVSIDLVRTSVYLETFVLGCEQSSGDEKMSLTCEKTVASKLRLNPEECSFEIEASS